MTRPLLTTLEAEPPCFQDSTGQRTYVIDGCAAFKIGRAKNPKQRLADCQVGSPVPLKLIATGCTDVEGLLHARFSEYRSHGEWFSNEGRPRLIALLAKARFMCGGCISCASLVKARQIVSKVMRENFLSRFGAVPSWQPIECSNQKHRYFDTIGWVDRHGIMEWRSLKDGPNLIDTARAAYAGELTSEAVWQGTASDAARRSRVPGLSLPRDYWFRPRFFEVTEGDAMRHYLAAAHTIVHWRPGCVACAVERGIATCEPSAAWYERWSWHWKDAA